MPNIKIYDISDINNVDYNDNLKSHRQLVQTHLDKFNALMSVELDKAVGNYPHRDPTRLASLEFDIGYGMLYCSAICSTFLFKRQRNESTIEVFRNLLKLYKWCTKEEGHSTHYETVKALAKAITPFLTNMQLLVYWIKDKDSLDEEFADILKPPIKPDVNAQSISYSTLINDLRASALLALRECAIQRLYGDNINYANTPPILTMVKM